MSATVRRATSADAGALAVIAAATFALACPPGTTRASSDAFVAAHLAETNFERYLADPTRALFLAEDDGTAIGYCMVVLTEPTDPNVLAAIKQHPTAELSKLYVAPGHHGAGVAGALLDAAIEVARANGAAGIWLGVNQFNARANRFYEKSGLARVGTKKFLVGENWEDDFVRERAL